MRESQFSIREKTRKKAPKWLSRAPSIFTGKKKRWAAKWGRQNSGQGAAFPQVINLIVPEALKKLHANTISHESYIVKLPKLNFASAYFVTSNLLSTII